MESNNSKNSHDHGLFTKKEFLILQLICKEMTSEEIGTELNVSIKTVEVHRYNMMKKTGAKNAVGLVFYALRNNVLSLVDIPESGSLKMVS